VSDTAANDPQTDKSGPLLRSIVEQTDGFEILATEVVPDSNVDITEILSLWVKTDVDLILTTGGTGFGQRDITPEVLHACYSYF
jgi:gephyrin